jgi:hypothetical protein
MATREFRSIVIQTAAIGLVAISIIIALNYTIPHVPLAEKKTFQGLLQVQMAIDEYNEAEKERKDVVLIMGSSVVERGVIEEYVDSSLDKNTIRTINCGVGGFFADANKLVLRRLLQEGIRPKRICYGVFIEDLNGHSPVHNTLYKDSNNFIYRDKSLPNVMLYGAKALSSIFDAPTLHIYLFAINHAFRNVENLNALQRLSFGDNMVSQDSTYILDSALVRDIEEIISMCKEHHIELSFFNTPLRPTINSYRDLPYLRRNEGYHVIESLAKTHSLPIWNLDKKGLFEDVDFKDSYHLNHNGGKKMSKILGAKISEWINGKIEQDTSELFF